MSLPTGGPWPPPPQGIAFAQQALWSAWLVGDPDTLRTAYGTAAQAGGNATGDTFFGSQRANSGIQQGGLINKVARFFWARPIYGSQRKASLHVPLASDIATASADLLFSEPPQFMTPEGEGNDKTKDRIDDVLNDGNFHAELVEAAEIAAALGGGWLRLVWDEDVAEYVMLDSVSADSAWGEWRWGRLQAVTFFTEYTEDSNSARSTVWRHLERHEPGAIFHGLYKGNDDTLGSSQPLVDHPATEPYAELVDAEGAILTGVKGMTAAYVANMRPQRRWRKIEELNNLGRSDYDGVEQLMDALDETYTSWMRDVRLAKSRIIVPEFMLDNLGAGKGMSWDEDKEVYTALAIAPNDNATNAITPQQFTIRVKEHMETSKQLVDEILRSAGYSANTFGGGEQGMVTATEVNSRERESDRTRDKKTRYWSQALEPLLTTWLELDALIFSTGASGEVEVQWADDSQPDPEALARTAELLNRAEAASVDTKVRMLHPDWDEEDIKKEVQAIQDESGSSMGDIGAFPPPKKFPGAPIETGQPPKQEEES